jgi:hypothetical protein
MLVEKEPHFKAKQPLVDVMVMMMMVGPGTSCFRVVMDCDKLVVRQCQIVVSLW